jgi:hypothetical protein
MKTKWENFLKGEEEQFFNKEAVLHEEIFKKLDFQRIQI